MSTSPTGQAIASQAMFFWNSENLAYLIPSTTYTLSGQVSTIVSPEFIVVDLEALALLGVLIFSTFLLNRPKGAKKATLRSFQVAALCLTILGTEIATFDNREFYLHVTQTQPFLNIATTFTNADLLLASIVIFVVSTGLLDFGRLQHQRY